MTSKDKEEGVANVAELGLVATGAAIGGPVGAGVGLAAALVAKLPKALQRGRKVREARFVERVAHYLEEDDADGAAEFIASHSETPEFAGTLERGYEAMRRALDPAAEECICLLTADHSRQGRPTDRRFVRAAALLEACDLLRLRTLNLITTAYIAAGEEGNRRRLFLDFGASVANRPPSFVVIAFSGREHVGVSGQVFAPKNLRRLLVDLAHYDYGEEWRSGSGGGGLPVEIAKLRRYGTCAFRFLHEHHEAVHALHRYLAPVRLMAATADPDDEQAALLERALQEVHERDASLNAVFEEARQQAKETPPESEEQE